MFILVSLLALALGVSFINPDFVAGLFNVLPAGGTFPPPVHQAAVYFGTAAASVNFILPVDTLVTILWLSYNLILFMLVFYCLRWIVNLVRGVATPSFGGNFTETTSVSYNDAGDPTYHKTFSSRNSSPWHRL